MTAAPKQDDVYVLIVDDGKPVFRAPRADELVVTLAGFEQCGTKHDHDRAFFLAKRIPGASVAGPGEVVVAVERIEALAQRIDDRQVYYASEVARDIRALLQPPPPPAPAVEPCACGHETTRIDDSGIVRRRWCGFCERSGPNSGTHEGATAAWNADMRAIRAARAAAGEGGDAGKGAR